MPLRINHLLLILFLLTTTLYTSVALWYWQNHIAPGILQSEIEPGSQLLIEARNRLSKLKQVNPTTVGSAFSDLMARRHGQPAIPSLLMLRVTTSDNRLIWIKRHGMTHDQRFIFQAEITPEQRIPLQTADSHSFSSARPLIIDLELNPANYQSQQAKWALITISAMASLGLPLLLMQLLVMRLIRPLVRLSETIDKVDTDNPEFHQPKALFISREVSTLFQSLNGLFSKLRQAKRLNVRANGQIVEERQNQARQHIELTRAQRFICEFLAYSTEQIRGPLDSINSTSLLLEETGLAPRQREYCRNLQNNSAYLIEQLEDLKDFTRLEAGQLLLDPIVFSPDILIDSLIREFHSKAKVQYTQLSYWIDPELPTMLRGDRRRIRQILKRLLNHSISITRMGQIALTVQQQQNQWIISIGDTGPSQSRLVKQQIMEPISGSGFGMTLLRGLAKRMGGQLSTNIFSGSGNDYQLSLPLQASATPPTEQNHSVLVASRNPMQQFCISNWLVRQGMKPLLVDPDAPELWPTGDALIACESLGNRRLKAFRAAIASPWLLITEKNRPDIHGISFSDWPICQKTIQQLRPNQPLIKGKSTRSKMGKFQLLLVDEHPISRRTLRHLLERTGFRVTEAESCREAMEVLSSRNFDLTLVDSLSDGYELTASIREMETGGEHMPILMMANNPQQTDYHMMHSNGINGLLLKPVNVSRLKASLEEAGLIDLISHLPDESVFS